MNNSNWLCETSEKDDIWITEISKWPSIVAYEYRTLREMCRKNNPYGALICLKDNFETVLKFETLLAFAWAEQNTDESFRAETISQLTTPNLSMGAWNELARILVKNLRRSGKELPEDIPLEKLYRKYNRLEIVNWRNQKIGHGAMELEEDDDFREDILERLSDLKEILELLGDSLEGQKLYSDGLCLEGPELARGLEVSGAITCTLEKSGTSFSADPYILIRKHEKRGRGVYFFDNQKSRTLTDFQTYSDGSRTRETAPHFELLRREFEKTGKDLGASADDKNLDEAENRELDLVQMSHGFVEPEHLTTWLKECVGNHDKGVFLLQMERGMGKSVFTEKLDTMYEKPLMISEDIDVRTYHFHRTQSAGSADVRSRIEWQWANQYRGGASWQRVPRMSDYERDGMSPSEAFCEFLKEVREYTDRRRHKEKILMVLDGLDEIADESLWPMLPGVDQLSEGVYVLLTSRSPEENGITGKLEETTGKLDISEKLVIAKESEENVGFLRSYIKKTGLKDLDDDRSEFLIRQSGFRVLYLGMLCRLAEYGMAIEDLPDPSRTVEKYMEILDECYGEKERIRIREILAVLTTLGMMEPLPLKTIGGLTAEGRLTLGLIGMVRDLSPMLKVQRSPEGNLYTMANPDLAEELRKQLPETEDTVRDLVVLGADQIKGGYPPELPEAEPVIAHIAELADTIPGGMAILGDDPSGMMRFVADAEDSAQYSKERWRVCDYNEQLVLLMKKVLGEEHPDTLFSMNNLANCYMNMGQYEKAVAMHEQVLELRKKALGEGHPDTLTTMSNLAVCYIDMGQYEKAAAMNEKVLEIMKRVLGKRHPDTLSSMNNLAICYCKMGQYEKAKAMDEKVLKLRKKVLGTDHPDTLSSMHNEASDYQSGGQYKKAAAMYEKALELKRKVLGEEHPNTLNTMSNLALCYSDMGQYERAVAMNEEVLELSKKVLGEEHPDTLSSMDSLANCYRAMGQYEKAASMHEKVLELKRKVLSAEHPATLSSMHNLTLCYSDMGQYEKAASICEEVLELMRKVLGEEHPDTLASMNSLALCYSDMGQHEKAAAMDEKVLELRKKVLGEEHPDTLSSMHNLATCYHNTGQHEKAAPMYEKVLELSKKALGKEHPDTLLYMENLATCYGEMGQHERAAAMHEKVLELRRKVLGAEHPSTLTTMSNLAECYRDMGQHEKAAAMHKEVLKLRKKVLGEEHPDTLISMQGLAYCYYKINQYERSAEIYEGVLELSKKVLGKEHYNTLSSMNNLAICYKNMGQYKKATAMYEEVAGLFKNMGLHKKAATFYEEVLELRSKVLGEEHPDTLFTMNSLAICYSDMGQHEKAVEIFKEVWELRKKVLGPEHQDTLLSMNTLAVCYMNMGQFERAAAIFKDVCKLSNRVLGEEHAVTNISKIFYEQCCKQLKK